MIKNDKGDKMKYSVKDLSIDEKLLLLTGQDNWSTNGLNGKVKSIFMADGPCGLRKIEKTKAPDSEGQLGINLSTHTRPATAMPAISVVANTWNEDMARLDGATIASECVEADVDVLLAPGVNIKRNALCGRNFEYFSEDPFLAGKLARAFIEGVQEQGVGTSLKHFIANNSERDRNSTSSEVDDRTLHEIYLPAFEEAVKAKPWTVMCSYNPINGVHASQNKKMLKTVLRDELGFDGTIVSDWGAVWNHPKAVKATLDIRMPYSESAFDELKSAYESGKLTEEEIDFCVQNVLNLIEKTETAQRKVKYTKSARHENAVTIAKEGIVLLKNQDNILPIKKDQKIAVLGTISTGIPQGGGSAIVTTDYNLKPLSQELGEKMGQEIYYGPAIWRDLQNTTSLIKQHMQKVYHSDVAILCVGEQTPAVSEGNDREKMKLTAVQEDLILRAAKYNENVVVLVYGGSAIDMSAWIDKVKAVVFVGYAGEGINEALASILTGETNPSGKLNETFPLCVEDTVTKGKLDDGLVDYYSEGFLVGYRHYDTNGKEVLYPFGHGLSYSQFEYSNLKIEKTGETDYKVSYDITNLSSVDGKEVSQVYVKDVFASVLRPEKELKGYSKDLIKAGETKRVSIDLDYRSFAYYSVVYDGWTIEDGDFEIMVGSSSRDIRLSQKLVVKTEE